MSKKHYITWLILLLLVLPLGIAACGEEEDDENGNGGTSGTSQETLVLAELSVSYEEGTWFGEAGADTIHLASDAASVGAETPPEDGALVDIDYILNDDMDAATAELTIVEHLDKYIADNDLPYGAAAQTPVGSGKTGAVANIAPAQTDQMDGMIYAIGLDDGIVFIIADVAEGALGTYATQLNTLVLNVELGAVQPDAAPADDAGDTGAADDAGDAGDDADADG